MSTYTQRSFSGGELAPSLYARVDFVKYATGARTLRNNIVLKHGGTSNRSGTMFIGEVNDSSQSTRLIEFVFNPSQTYVIEIGHQYLRFMKNAAYLSDASVTITGITKADPAVVTTSGSHGLTNGDEIYVNGVVGMLEINNRNFKITSLTSTTFSLQLMDGVLDLDSTSYTTYVSDGTGDRIYEITTTYTASELFEIQFVQSADVVTIVHPSHAPAELTRSGDTSWALNDLTFEPSITPPVTNLLLTGTAGSDSFTYAVTTYKDDTYEESVTSADITTASLADPSVSAPHTISWDAVSGGAEYGIYRKENGVYGFVGVSGTTSYNNDSLTTDTSQTPPITRNPFNGADDYPSAVTYYQQRLALANTNNDTEKIYLSKSADFKNFTIRSPLQEDDSITFTIAGRQVNEVKHMFDLDSLIVLTVGGEWTVKGGASGVITPTAINPQQYSYNGSGDLSPIMANGNALYVQARGSIVRDLGFEFEVDGYRGNDLTIISNHLFEGFTLVDWAYQKTPQSIVWAVRSDGVLLGLTYLREQQMIAWHRHDFTDGLVESVTVVPEGDEDFLYLVIKRTINSIVTRYVERMNTRQVFDTSVEDLTFMDSYLTYDGRNSTATTMAISGGTLWDYRETLTLTASASYFVAGDVGSEVHVNATDGDIVRLAITGYTSATIVSVTPNKTVPVSLRGTATTSWSKAVSTITGLWHLEGEELSIFADSFVVASPFNSSYDTVTVATGAISLDKAYAVIHMGRPFISDLETLDIDLPTGQTMADKERNISQVTMYLEKTRGLFVGAKPPASDAVDALEDLAELKLRNDEDYDSPVALNTGPVKVNIRSEWNSNGRVFVRQVDPVPSTILSISPGGKIPYGG